MPPLNDKTKGPEIKEAMDGLVLAWPEVTESKMFGSACYRASGVLFVMIGGKGLITTKLSSEQRDTAIADSEANIFIGRGKEVPAWTEFPVDGAADVTTLESVLKDSCQNALDEADSK